MRHFAKQGQQTQVSGKTLKIILKVFTHLTLKTKRNIKSIRLNSCKASCLTPFDTFILVLINWMLLVFLALQFNIFWFNFFMYSNISYNHIIGFIIIYCPLHAHVIKHSLNVLKALVKYSKSRKLRFFTHFKGHDVLLRGRTVKTRWRTSLSLLCFLILQVPQQEWRQEEDSTIQVPATGIEQHYNSLGETQLCFPWSECERVAWDFNAHYCWVLLFLKRARLHTWPENMSLSIFIWGYRRVPGWQNCSTNKLLQLHKQAMQNIFSQ